MSLGVLSTEETVEIVEESDGFEECCADDDADEEDGGKVEFCDFTRLSNSACSASGRRGGLGVGLLKLSF